MAEYIEREAAINAVANNPHNIAFKTSKAIQEIKEIPTADVAEVKHGCWIEDGYYDISCVCSYCGAEAQHISKFNETFDYDWEENLQSTGYEETTEYIRTPYCPNCGAKMKGNLK